LLTTQRVDWTRAKAPFANQVCFGYLGLIPREYSSGGHQRLGAISKQGNRFMRMLLVEAAQIVRIESSPRVPLVSAS
jgi:hypothetical protein